MRNPDPVRSAVAFVVVILTWASMPLLLKYFVAYLDAWTVNGVRYAMAVCMWLPYLFLCWRRGLLNRALFRDARVPAACHLFGQVCWGLSPYFNDASIMHFIGRSTFLFMIIFGFWLLQEERLLIRRSAFWVGVAGTIVGVFLMYKGGAAGGSTSLTGVLLLLGAGAGWASYGVTIKKYMQNHGARISFTVISLYTLPALLALMFWLGDWQEVFHISWVVWSWLAVSAVTAIALAHVLLYVVIKHYGPIVADGVFQLIPFLTVVGAYILFGERMTPMQWWGGLVLIGAAYALLLAKRAIHRSKSESA